MHRSEIIKQWYRNNINDKVSSKIVDIVDKNNTIGNIPHVGNVVTKTLFNEIDIVNYDDMFDTSLLKKDNIKTKNLSKKEFIVQFIDLFKESVFDNWEQDKFHIILHSSGFDSRILASIILKLRKELGESWFGTTKFLCFSPEQELARKIINYYGIDDSDFMYYDLSVTEEWSNFEKCYDYLNGASFNPINLTRLATNEIEKIYNIENYQIFSAGYFNEIFDWSYFNRCEVSPIEFLKKYYLHSYSQFASSIQKGHVIYPILNPHMLNFLSDTNISLSKIIRKDILKFIDPILHNFENIFLYKIYLNEKTAKKIQNDYNTSIYGKRIKAEVPNERTIQVNTFWYNWSSASFYENLINK